MFKVVIIITSSVLVTFLLHFGVYFFKEGSSGHFIPLILTGICTALFMDYIQKACNKNNEYGNYGLWIITLLQHRFIFFLVFVILNLFMPICKYLSFTTFEYKYIALDDGYYAAGSDERYLECCDMKVFFSVPYSERSFEFEEFQIQSTPDYGITVHREGRRSHFRRHEYYSKAVPTSLGYRDLEGGNGSLSFMESITGIFQETIMSKGVYTILFALYVFFRFETILKEIKSESST